MKSLENYRAEFFTRRLAIRTLLSEDVSLMYVDWLNTSEVNSFLESRHQTHTLSSVVDFVTSVDRRNDALIFGLFLIENGRHIGNMKISEIDYRLGSGEIGYLIGDRLVWGKGFATEAIMALADFAFSELNLRQLTAGAYSANLGSIRVLEKCGFEMSNPEVPSERLEGREAQDILRFSLQRFSP